MEKPKDKKVDRPLFGSLASIEEWIPKGVKLLELIDFEKEEARRKIEEELKKTSLGRELL